MNKECYQKAIRLLTQRDYSRPKLRKKLVENGFEIDDALECVEKLYAEGYLKEQWYIEGRIKAFMRKGYSQSHIKQRLAQEELYIDIDYIQSIFADNLHDEDEQMIELIQKKASRYLNAWPELDYKERQKIKAKVIRALISKGYSPNLGLAKIDQFFSNI